MLNPEPTSTKNGKDRYVDASGVLCRLFETLRIERTKLALAQGWRPIPPWAVITGNGTPISQRFVETDFKRVLKRAGLPEHLTPHSMRHTFACIHIARACKPKWLQQQMGHSSISVTLDRYGAWWNLEDHEAAERLGALVDGSEMAAESL